MGTVYRKTATKPLPADAEVFTRKGERLARWKDSKHKIKTAPLTIGRNGQDRIVVTARTYLAKYRDGAGVVREVPTGCRDETAARRVLAELERRAELVKAGVMSATEDAVADHQATPLSGHIKAFDEHLRSRRVSKVYREDQLRYLRRLAADCSFSKLSQLDRSALERWLAQQTAGGMSARSCNA